MVEVKIVRFEPQTASPEEWRRFHAYRRRRHEERDPGDPVLDDRTVEAWLKRPGPYWDERFYAVLDATDPEVQIGDLTLEVMRPESPTYEENRHILSAWPAVLRPYRRQGLGHRLLAASAARARSEGRTLLISHTNEEDGKAFVQAIGATVALRARESRLALDRVDWPMVEAWEREGARRSPDTTLRWCDGRIDDDLLEAYCATLTEVWNDMPRDDLERGDEAFTPSRRRQREETLREGGARNLTALTVEPSGEVSGLTEMGYFPAEKWLIHQWMTGVRKRDRGRGLGKWLKAAMLLRIRKELPQVRVVVTANAASNAAMLSINERLGFQPHREGMAVQMSLEDLEAYLGSRGVESPPEGWTRRDSNPGSPA